MHSTLENVYHAALFVPSLEPYHHCEIYSSSLKGTWINHLAIPSGTVNCLIQAQTRENGIDGVNVSLVHILEQGFV